MKPVIVGLVQRYGFAILSTILATWARICMQPVLGDRVPFGIYFLSVIFTAWVAGTGPAILALAGGIIAAAHWIIPPSDSWWLPHPADQMALFIYGIVGAVAVLLFHRSAVEAVLLQQRASENEDLTGKLTDADQRKDQFLALLAHELRNPLAPIRTALAILDREESLSPHGQEVRFIIRRQIDQLIRIVDDLLDVSRFVRGQMRMSREVIDLRNVVDLALHTVQPLIDEAQHDINFVRPHQPVRVLGDDVRLTQVAANLLTNAARYTPRHGRIRVLLDCTDTEARLQVCDNGIGIPREVQSHIFDLFAQADSSHTRDQGGLGLGLAIVKQIVELHSGTVCVASDGPGRGSCFSVTLALASLDPVRQQPAAPFPREESQPQPTIEKHILIVDDNQDGAATLATLLALEGYTTRIANDGHTALNLYADFAPDVVLLDIGMPGMDGYEVARRIRQGSGLRPCIVAVSGWGQDSDRVLSRNAGIDHHLVKPVDVTRLLQLLGEPPLDDALGREHSSPAVRESPASHAED